ncbi:sulfatase family protein [Streptomyces spiralis]|uniref:sulfatase family protein n=1 Tax=Streptomyces spiralis TaxID=66376 RepID=UPI0033E52C44
MGRKILLITTDQQRYEALGCNGGAIARTPVLDRLAASGINYRRAYTQNAHCTPARVTILTGQYTRTHGVVSNARALAADGPSIAAYLAENGYRTALLGKAHFEPMFDPLGVFTEGQLAGRGSTGPLRGFEHAELALHGAFPQLHYGAWLQEHHPDQLHSYITPLSSGNDSPETGAPEARPNPIQRDLYHTDWVADRTIDYLKNVSADEDWFVWMSFPDPHHPWDPPASEMHRVSWRDLDLPPAHPGSSEEIEKILAGRPAHWLAYYNGTFRNIEGAPGSFVPATLSHDALREINAKTHVMNELIDEACGRVLRYLTDRGWDTDTDIIFTSDHGELQGDYGLLYKGPFHGDALLRLPFIWRPAPSAGIASAVIDEPVGSLDIAATLCEIAGLEQPAWVEGKPLPTAAGSDRERALSEWDSFLPGYGMHMRTIYRDGWLCTAYEPSTVNEPNGFERALAQGDPAHVRVLGFDSHPMGPQSPISYGGTEGELYNLIEDPHQFVNLWDDRAYASLRRDLVADLYDSLPSTHNSVELLTYFA